MGAVFTYQEFEELLVSFASSLPQILGRSPTTAHLVKDVDRLLDATESPFTVAVMGQMRSGKSTLLNALVGRDLAVVTDKETTATTNWFKYTDSPEEAERFCVYWREPPEGAAPQETRPLSDISRWIGDSQEARRTRYLEFFAPSPFLKEANIVDTPGTRSLIQDHTDKARELISGNLDEQQERIEERLQDESRRQAHAADAILYVMNPVERVNDQDWLDEFDRLTRTPGSHPYNSIGIVHKWEGRFDSEDPWAQIQSKTERMRATFSDRLSCVIPVSAPLGICAERLKDDLSFWNDLLRLGKDSSREAIQYITSSDSFFLDEEESCCMTPSQREQLWNRIRSVYPKVPWPTLQLLVRTAHFFPAGSGDALRARVAEMSGMARLREELRNRYFARAKMIKAFTILAKAWVPCQRAQTALRNRKETLNTLLAQAREASTLLRRRLEQGEAELTPVLAYVEESLATVEYEFRLSGEVLRAVSIAVVPISDAFEDMKRDLRMLSCLADGRDGFGPPDAACLRALFGGHGPNLAERIRPFAADSENPTLDEVDRAIERVLRMTPVERTEATRSIQEWARTRLGQVADWIEERTTRLER